MKLVTYQILDALKDLINKGNVMLFRFYKDV